MTAELKCERCGQTMRSWMSGSSRPVVDDHLVYTYADFNEPTLCEDCTGAWWKG